MSDSSNPQPAVGAAIKELRARKGMTQEVVAQEAGVTVAHLSKIERGRTNPTWGTVTALAETLGVTLVEVARRTEAHRP